MHHQRQTILALCALLCCSCLTSFAEKQPAPGWELKNLAGQPVKLSDFEGKVVLLNFWATWCPPCRDEIPDLVSLQQQYSPRGLVVVGIAMDGKGAAIVQPFAKKMEINYPLVIGDQKTAEAYGGIEALPTTFIIDRKGNVVAQQKGAVDRGSFEASIKPLL